MDWASSPSLAEVAERACTRCKKNKRRCDKALPSCSLCLRLNQTCLYASEADSSQTDEVGDLRCQVRNLEQIVSSLSSDFALSSRESSNGPITQGVDHPGFYAQAAFLDTEMAKRLQPSFSYPSINIPEGFANIINDKEQVRCIVSQYIQTVHPWMPIISKIRLDRMISSNIRPDGALLIGCMKLLISTPNFSPRTALYISVKQFASTLEAAGFLSLRSLQAGLLIAVYEMGHSVYPVAYTTVGLVARQGIALGIHKESALQLPQEPLRWLDWEERQRVWWLILILDRYGTLGSEDRPLCTEDPPGSSFVPTDDSAWDEGHYMYPERVLVSSPPDVKISFFARLAQASNLVGRVIRHCEDEELQIQFAVEEFQRLYHTSQSLSDIISLNGDESTVNLSSIALCYSAMLKISSNHSCDSFLRQTNGEDAQAESLARSATLEAINLLKHTISRVIDFASYVEQSSQSDLNSISIFVPHCIYLCAVSLCWMATETNDQTCLTGLSSCKKALELINQRWHIAGVYLKILSSIQDALDHELE